MTINGSATAYIVYSFCFFPSKGKRSVLLISNDEVNLRISYYPIKVVNGWGVRNKSASEAAKLKHIKNYAEEIIENKTLFKS